MYIAFMFDNLIFKKDDFLHLQNKTCLLQSS